MFWIVLSITLDQMTKHLASIFLQMQFISIFKFFILTFATNKGIAFGLFPGVKEIVIYLSLFIVVGISLIPSFVRLKKSTNIFLELIVGGALGNLIDRIRFGYVIDFITIKYWPTVFNVADIFIFLGSMGLTIELLISELSKKSQKTYQNIRREHPNGYTSHIKRRRLATGQISDGKDAKLDLANVHTKGNKERGSISEWNIEEAELQGEVWGYNYLECARDTRTSGNTSREYTS